jgi:Flp pilus assembly protein protease CpaA
MSGGYEIGLWLLLIVASITDLIWGKIFNWINLAFFIGALICRFYFEGYLGAVSAVWAVLAAFAFFFPLYLLKAMAAGDVKLLMVIGAWTNVVMVSRIAAVSIAVGAFVGLFVLVKNRGLRQGATSVAEHFRAKAGVKSQRMPFAPAFLCAFLILQVFERYGWSVI